MSHAILIAGNSSRFLEPIYHFRSYLTKEQLVTPKRIKIFLTAYMAEEIFNYRLSVAIAAKTNKPLLILFCGHGYDLGWALDDTRIFSYFQLSKMLLVGRRPITILNDCCHAMELSKRLENQSVSPKRLSLIGAAESGEETPGGLAEIALNSWKQRRPVRFGPELRWGEKFDHYYYGCINKSQ